MSDFMNKNMNRPVLFACGSGVLMPHVGADEARVKPHRRPSSKAVVRTVLPSKEVKEPVNNTYLKKVSTGLTFSEDVVRDRCFHTLPYDEKYFYEALDVSNIIPTPPKNTQPIGRHNNRGSDQKHLPCHIKKRSTHKLKPMKRKILEKALQMHQEALECSSPPAVGQEDILADPTQPGVFLTQADLDQEREKSQLSDNEWDEYLMSLLSETTARWIVGNKVEEDDQQDKLTSMLNTYYGPTDEKAELIRDSASDGDLTTRSKGSSLHSYRQKWKKGDETLLDKVRELQKGVGKPTDPYSEDNAAAFYRLPAGMRRAKKNQEKEQAGAINTTAHKIEVKSYEPPPPPTLKDYINPAVGDKMFDTDNMFQQEWLTGKQQVYQGHEEQDKIVMDSDTRYLKHLQKETPRPPEVWFPPTDVEREQRDVEEGKVRSHVRGMHRWDDLPQPIDDTAEKLSLMMPGLDTLMAKSPDQMNLRHTKDNETLIQIVSDWRTKWNLDMRYADATPDDLIRDMADLHVHIRLKAITTCARAAEYKPPPEPGIQLECQVKKASQIKLLPENLFIALECCLDDDNIQVRRAAAIALYTLERPTNKAENILRKTLKEATSVDRWTAAQCLAYYGECDSEVVGELVKQLLNTEDLVRHEMAATLLARLSENSTLVHSMLGEQLNSSSWRHRVMVCKVMPKLDGSINKDLVHKLTYLMWNDWHGEVQKAAAQTLGKTGHGKALHDELRDKITQGNERERTEAVSKVGHLGIMTAKLLPAFLQCFHDNYVSVRMEACLACTNLKIKDQAVIDKLVFLATYDPIWKVKALALQAMGIIGVVTPPVRDCILWALRYEDQPGVRAEACHTLIILNLQDSEVAQILQDRLLVETSDVVRQEILAALEMFGISPTEDMDMVAQIKNEVRKLCTRNNICAHIALNEADDEKRNNINRMIYKTKAQKKQDDAEAASHQAELHRQLTPRHERPRVVVTPDTSSVGHGSRDGRAMTPSADREVAAILGRPDTSESDVTTERSRSPLSESGSEEAAGSEVDVQSIVSRLKSASHMGRIEEADEELEAQDSREVPGKDEPEEEQEEDTNTAQPSQPNVKDKREIVLGQKQSYVEIPSKQSKTDDVSDDIVKIKYMSPTGSMSTLNSGSFKELQPSESSAGSEPKQEAKD